MCYGENLWVVGFGSCEVSIWVKHHLFNHSLIFLLKLIQKLYMQLYNFYHLVFYSFFFCFISPLYLCE